MSDKPDDVAIRRELGEMRFALGRIDGYSDGLLHGALIGFISAIGGALIVHILAAIEASP